MKAKGLRIALEWLALAIGVLLAGVALVWMVWSEPSVPVVRLSAQELPANGVSSVSVLVEVGRNRWWHGGEDGVRVEVRATEGRDLVRLGKVVRGEGRWRQDLIAGMVPGRVKLEVLVTRGEKGWRFDETVALVPDEGDTDGDGFPNAVELVSKEDRVAFRRWFTAIAVSQASSLARDWPVIHQDCAGLLRYAYKEALRRHDAAWFAAHPGVHVSTARDVGRYHYPDVPLVGTSLFRTGDPEAPFGPVAVARVLRDENALLVSRNVADALSGDLLFFEHGGRAGPVIHSMVVVVEDTGPGEGDIQLVYHTGPITEGVSTPDGSGSVRYIRLEDLLQHPDPSWRPRGDNPAFSGVYRWRILWGR